MSAASPTSPPSVPNTDAGSPVRRASSAATSDSTAAPSSYGLAHAMNLYAVDSSESMFRLCKALLYFQQVAMELHRRQLEQLPPSSLVATVPTASESLHPVSPAGTGHGVPTPIPSASSLGTHNVLPPPPPPLTTLPFPTGVPSTPWLILASQLILRSAEQQYQRQALWYHQQLEHVPAIVTTAAPPGGGGPPASQGSNNNKPTNRSPSPGARSGSAGGGSVVVQMRTVSPCVDAPFTVKLPNLTSPALTGKKSTSSSRSPPLLDVSSPKATGGDAGGGGGASKFNLMASFGGDEVTSPLACPAETTKRGAKGFKISSSNSSSVAHSGMGGGTGDVELVEHPHHAAATKGGVTTTTTSGSSGTSVASAPPVATFFNLAPTTPSSSSAAAAAAKGTPPLHPHSFSSKHDAEQVRPGTMNSGVHSGAGGSGSSATGSQRSDSVNGRQPSDGSPLGAAGGPGGTADGLGGGSEAGGCGGGNDSMSTDPNTASFGDKPNAGAGLLPHSTSQNLSITSSTNAIATNTNVAVLPPRAPVVVAQPSSVITVGSLIDETSLPPFGPEATGIAAASGTGSEPTPRQLMQDFSFTSADAHTPSPLPKIAVPPTSTPELASPTTVLGSLQAPSSTPPPLPPPPPAVSLPVLPAPPMVGTDIVLSVDAWENQIRIGTSYQSSRLPGGRPVWSGKNGESERLREAFLLPLGFAWRSPWHVDCTGVEIEGWRYASTFTVSTKKCSAKPSLMSFVRRRRWFRDMGLARPGDRVLWREVIFYGCGYDHPAPASVGMATQHAVNAAAATAAVGAASGSGGFSSPTRVSALTDGGGSSSPLSRSGTIISGVTNNNNSTRPTTTSVSDLPIPIIVAAADDLQDDEFQRLEEAEQQRQHQGMVTFYAALKEYLATRKSDLVPLQSVSKSVNTTTTASKSKVSAANDNDDAPSTDDDDEGPEGRRGGGGRVRGSRYLTSHSKPGDPLPLPAGVPLAPGDIYNEDRNDVFAAVGDDDDDEEEDAIEEDLVACSASSSPVFIERPSSVSHAADTVGPLGMNGRPLPKLEVLRGFTRRPKRRLGAPASFSVTSNDGSRTNRSDRVPTSQQPQISSLGSNAAAASPTTPVGPPTIALLKMYRAMPCTASLREKVYQHGVPYALRGQMWLSWSGALDSKLMSPGYFEELLVQLPARFGATMEDPRSDVNQDVHRTLASHPLFDSGKGVGAVHLRSILYAYLLHSNAKYHQCFSFIAAALLLNVDSPEDAFWLFVTLLNSICPVDYFDSYLHACDVKLVSRIVHVMLKDSADKSSSSSTTKGGDMAMDAYDGGSSAFRKKSNLNNSNPGSPIGSPARSVSRGAVRRQLLDAALRLRAPPASTYENDVEPEDDATGLEMYLIFAHGWLQGLCCAHFPVPIACRLLDIVFAEGTTTIYLRLIIHYFMNYIADTGHDVGMVGQRANAWSRGLYDIEGVLAKMAGEKGIEEVILRHRKDMLERREA